MVTTAQNVWAHEVDFDAILERYNLVVKPLAEHDRDRSWCVVPYCRNDATQRSVICRPHKLIAAAAGWSVADLVARELLKASRPGAGCANVACPNSEITRPSRVSTSDRQRQYAPRRFYGRFTPGGEYLCKVCALLVNTVAGAFEPGVSPVEKAVEKTMHHARINIPHATYEKLTGQMLVRSKARTIPELTIADGYTLDQFVLGLGQYVGFWASVSDQLYVMRKLLDDPDEVEAWLTNLNDAATESVEEMIAAGELPDYSIPYHPGQITLDAMLGRFPKGE